MRGILRVEDRKLAGKQMGQKNKSSRKGVDSRRNSTGEAGEGQEPRNEGRDPMA